MKYCDFFIEFLITDYCNLDCKFCSQPTPVGKTMISYERLKEISEVFSDYTFSSCKITGGEPTLHPEFDLISNNIRKLFSAGWYDFATNGAQLQKHLEPAKNYDHIALSLYPGKNDDIFNLIKSDTSLPGYDLLDRDGELSFCDIFEKYPEEYNKTDYCIYGKSIVIYHNRVTTCARCIGNCVQYGFKYEDYSAPIDENWVENLNNIRSKMKPLCDACWTKVNKAEVIKFETVRMEDSIFSTRLALQNMPEEHSFVCLQTFSKNDWVKILLGKDAWQPNISPMEPGDISSDDNISLIQSCYVTSWFDIPFCKDQTFRVTLNFTEENIVPFYVIIEDTNYLYLVRNLCAAEKGFWEWTVTVARPRERIRLKLMSDDFFTIKPPVFASIFSDARSLDFMKLKNTETDNRILRGNLGESEGRLEEKSRLYDEAVQTIDGLRGNLDEALRRIESLLASRSYCLGRIITWLPRKIRDLFTKQ
jgi:hypothetical protein